MSHFLEQGELYQAKHQCGRHYVSERTCPTGMIPSLAIGTAAPR